MKIKPNSSEECGRKMRGSGHKLKQERFKFNIGETFSPADSEAGWLIEVMQSLCLEVFKTQLSIKP